MPAAFWFGLGVMVGVLACPGTVVLTHILAGRSIATPPR